MKKENWVGIFTLKRTTKLAIICGISLALQILHIRFSGALWVAYLVLCAAFVFMDAAKKILWLAAIVFIGSIAVSALMQLGFFWIPVVMILLSLFLRKRPDDIYQRLIREVTEKVQKLYLGAAWDWENKEIKQRCSHGQFAIMITEADGLTRHRYWCMIEKGHCTKLVYIESKDSLRNEDYKALLEHIGSCVREIYPDSVWDWENKEVRNRLQDGKFVIVITDGDGKTRYRYWCIIRNLKCETLLFIETKEAPKDDRRNSKESDSTSIPNEKEPKKPEMKMPDPVDWDSLSDETDYSFAAFEWVESHIPKIKEQLSKALAKGETQILLPTEELPSYQEAVAKQLAGADLEGYQVSVCKNGILIRKGEM